MKKEITPGEIFAANQVLTLGVVKHLIGKKIAITNPEYYMNRPDVRVFIVKGIQTAFDEASSIPCVGYDSLQHNWLSNRNEKAMARAKKRTVLMYNGDKPYATCDIDNPCLTQGTFFGSDADREIYYILIEE